MGPKLPQILKHSRRPFDTPPGATAAAAASEQRVTTSPNLERRLSALGVSCFWVRVWGLGSGSGIKGVKRKRSEMAVKNVHLGQDAHTSGL